MPASGNRLDGTATAWAVQGINVSMLFVTVLFVDGSAFAQSSAVLSVAARVVASCTTTSTNLQSTCSQQTLARQSDITNASARISTSGGETTVTHKGGLPPTIEMRGDEILVSF